MMILSLVMLGGSTILIEVPGTWASIGVNLSRRIVLSQF
jgi:hypothetical protein